MVRVTPTPPAAATAGLRPLGRIPVSDVSPIVECGNRPTSLLRHAQFSVTMEVYAPVPAESTRQALRKLGESLDRGLLLYFAAVQTTQGPLPGTGNGP